MTQENFEDLFDSKLKLEDHFNKILKPILDSNKGGVVAIHAKFGMGKTFLCNLYKNFLKDIKDEKIKCQIWNAAIYPHTTPPFSWINNEIARSSEAANSQGLLEKAKSVLNNMDFSFNLNASIIPGFLSAGVEVEKPEERKTLAQEIEEYKDALRKSVNGNRTIIFIDDIDRVKPSYALEIIEQLKYYFGIPSLVFVLMVNMDTLSESITHHYGISDSTSYLEKFLLSPIYHMKTRQYNEYSALLQKHQDRIATVMNNRGDFDQQFFCHFKHDIVSTAYTYQVNYREFNKSIDSIILCLSDSNITRESFIYLTYYIMVAFSSPKTITQLKRGYYQEIKNQFIKLKENPLPQEIDESKDTYLLDLLINTYSDNLDPDNEKDIVKLFQKNCPFVKSLSDVRKRLDNTVVQHIHWL